MNRVKRIARPRIADEVFESLRRAILDRDFMPGERLKVRSLATDFDVSEMPVRHAVNRLQTVGLVEIKPRSGTFVAQLDKDELLETFDIRRALECLAVESAVSRISDAQLAELDALLAKMDECLVKGLVAERHDNFNMLFHRRIVEIAGNGKLLEMYEDLHAHIKIARVHSSSRDWLRRVQRAQQEHRRILAGLAGRDRQETIAALSEHIDRAGRNLIRDHEAFLAAGAGEGVFSGR